MSEKVILVTGSSSGFGLLTARTLAAAGHRVYASMRETGGKNAGKAREAERWAEEHGARLEPIELDIGSEESAEAAVGRIVEEAGRIDVLVNNAGMLVMGVTEAFTPEQVARCFDTNVLGVVRCNRAVLPHMRERRSGLIVYVGSVTSCVVSPFQGPYVAAKAAEDKIAETTHYEVSRYGVDSAIVQPGAYTSGTNHFPNAVRPEDAERASAYDLIAELPGQLAGRLGSLVMPHKREEAQDVADAILRLVDAPAGSRLFRAVIDPQSHGAEPINAVAEEMQREFMERLGIEDLRRVSVGGQAPAGAPDRVV
jgi:NAD(P)-dependent dehydrogenase (short-subunit alcohol dehydrogenase family)